MARESPRPWTIEAYLGRPPGFVTFPKGLRLVATPGARKQIQEICSRPKGKTMRRLTKGSDGQA